MRTTAAALASVAVLLVSCGLVSCGSGSEESARLAGSDGSPGAEATEVGEPTAEAPGSEAGGSGGDGGVAVQLPGMPIGGGALFFTASEPTQCAEVNLTGDPVPGNVQVTIDGFGVPAGFTIAGGSCGGIGPCLGGQVLTTAGGTCSVLLTWNGQAVADEAELSVTAATAACPDQPSCDAAVATVASAGPGALDMDVDGTFGDQTAPSGGEEPASDPASETADDPTPDSSDEGPTP